MRCLITLMLIALPALAWADDYYVDPGGNDAADGLTSAKPWKTLARAEQQPLKPGDKVLLRAGGVWHESLRIKQAGTSDKPIVLSTWHPDTTSENPRAVISAAGDYCIDASTSHLHIDHLLLTHARNPQRGAVMVWASADIEDLRITDCEIVASAGRGIWIAGDQGKSVKNVRIENNLIRDNAGSGILVAKLAESKIAGNTFLRNCREPVDAWQAAIRVWSDDVHDLTITGNVIREQRWYLDKAGSMGIHIDEVGPKVTAADNDISDCDGSGIEIENTRDVTITNNIIGNVHTGIFVYRAGHGHQITRNTVVARALGISLQGHRANGVDAGPEIEVDGKLVTNNVIRGNVVLADKWASLKLVGGAEDGKNTIDTNCFGAERPGMFEWGERQFGTVAELDRVAGNTKTTDESPKFDKSPTTDFLLYPNWPKDTGARRGQ